MPQGNPCPPDCGGNLICAVFSVPGGGRLATYCAQAAGPKLPGSQCAKDDECQSGLCVTGGKALRLSQRPRSIDAKITANGVSGTVPACVP